MFASCVLWGDPVEGAARELLATADATGDDGAGGTLADATRFLGSLLENGLVPVKGIKAEADGAGFSWPTIRRAKKALRIEALKIGMKAGWAWGLPGQGTAIPPLGYTKVIEGAEDVQQKEVSTFGKTEYLRHVPGFVEVEI